jgi:hypothetical protein
MADGRRNALAYIIELFRRSHLVQRWAPVVIWMAGIFYFSSRPEPLGFLPSPTQWGPIGKVAHFAEYAGLAVLLHRALREHRGGGAEEQGSKGAEEQGSRGTGETHLSTSAPQHLCTESSSALIALAYAILDELHQELSPGRGFELADVGFDLAGIISALGLIWVRGRGAGAYAST